MNTDSDTPVSRVLHVPLTDTEWLGLRRLALETDRTLGSLVADALLRAYLLTEGGTK